MTTNESNQADKKPTAKPQPKAIPAPELPDFVNIGGGRPKVPVSARIEANVMDEYNAACVEYETFLKERNAGAEVAFSLSAIVENALKTAAAALRARLDFEKNANAKQQ